MHVPFLMQWIVSFIPGSRDSAHNAGQGPHPFLGNLSKRPLESERAPADSSNRSHCLDGIVQYLLFQGCVFWVR